MSDLAMKVLKWQSTGDVGISSATLASIACGLKKNIYALLKSEMKTYGNKAPETYRRISELRKD